MPNQNPEQIARDKIDALLRAAGWAVQGKNEWDSTEGDGQAVREYQTDTGPADYVLFIDKKPVGVIEARKETLGQNITTVEDQTGKYADAKLKYVQHDGILLPFLYEATKKAKAKKKTTKKKSTRKKPTAPKTKQTPAEPQPSAGEQTSFDL